MQTKANQSRATTGIRKRHSRRCLSLEGGGCTCRPSFEAQVFDQRSNRRLRRSFATAAEAKVWRNETSTALRRGTLATPSTVTLRQAAEAWLEGAQSGLIRNRSDETFKPSVLRGYEASLRDHILPELGSAKLSAIRRLDLQDLADRLLTQPRPPKRPGTPARPPLDPSSVRNILMPVRAICRRAVERGELAANPTSGLNLPAPRGRRDRICSPTEAAALIDALPEQERALWATAFYAGLRLGELRALRWEDIDLQAGLIRVERSWDPTAGPVEPKSRAGRRQVPVVATLRSMLAAHALSSGRREGFVFGRTETVPFGDTTIRNRAEKAWADAGLTPSGLHEARHTFASILIAAGVGFKAVSAYMGHSSITITLDRYSHLMPGQGAETVERVDAYLAAATAAQTAAQAL